MLIHLDRSTAQCPSCNKGTNSAAEGGKPTCFHCGACDYVECADYVNGNPRTEEEIWQNRA